MLLEAKISYSSNLKDSTLKIWQKYCHQLKHGGVGVVAAHTSIHEVLSLALVREIASSLDYSLDYTATAKCEIFLEHFYANNLYC